MIYENRDYPIWRFRNCLRLTQLEAANIMGISQPTISRLEKEKVLSIKNFSLCTPLLTFYLHLVKENKVVCGYGGECERCDFGNRPNIEMAEDNIFAKE